ncbi:cytochrome P450 [Mycena pura]|uniref:Cytochrome P450 n=1 Tax=Mycena pura TaxID=153505 RepID=A0AAD6YAA6_9AGAR|nr:cytochrome P450 [Mycena pura]
MSYTTAFSALSAAAAALVLLWISRPRRTYGIGNIAGPPSPSWIFGNMLQLLRSPQYGECEFEWRKMYGPIYRIKGCLGQNRLMVSDPIALQYILNSPSFFFSTTLQAMLLWLLGPRSVILRTGDDHRRLRASLNPAFTASAVRRYKPVFVKVARSITEQLNNSGTLPVDMCPLLSDATLKSVSEVVFGCPVEDLGADFIENNTQILHLSSSQSAGQILFDTVAGRLPRWILHQAIHLPTKTFGALRAQLKFADREGWRIVRERTEAAKLGLETEGDLYSVLVNSVGSDGISLSEEDIAGQTSLIMTAGQDTAGNTLTFALIELAKNPQLQDSLRAEIHAALGNDHENIGYDSMPLLNAFIKEVLRVYPAEPLSERVASEDVVLPLSGSIATTAGKQINQILIRKGDILTIAVASYQRMETRWGDDANTFRPGRWLDGTVQRGEAIGPYANLLSFHGGPHSCLGWRFAILEIQVFLCELVGKFSFSLPADHSIEVRVATTLIPTDSQGKKCALLSVKHIL